MKHTKRTAISEEAAREQIEAFAMALSAQTGVPFDFSLEALARLDEVLRAWLDLATVYDDERPSFDHLVLPIARYVAETLRRHGARWIEVGWPLATGGPEVVVVALATERMLDLAEVTRSVLVGTISPCFQRLALEAPRDAL